MRRIYESDALDQDDETPFKPGGESTEYAPQSFRSLPSRTLSNLLIPRGLRSRCITVRITTPQQEFDFEEAVPFRVELKNRLPVPLTLPTRSPVRWTWAVDGRQEAADVDLREPPEREGKLQFSRGERKQFRREWSQLFQVSKDRWIQAEPGEYTISAYVNVSDPDTQDLIDHTNIVIRDCD